jgi:hypothetical protein
LVLTGLFFLIPGFSAEFSQQYGESLLRFQRFQGTFPDGNHCPAIFTKRFYRTGIIRLIRINLIHPPFGAGGWYLKVFAISMAMPEAAVYKNYGFVFGENDVGFARQSFSGGGFALLCFASMQSVSKTPCMQKPPHKHLRLCIRTADAAHIIASYLPGVYVRH